MTLLELLVKELPRRGGWPEGSNFVACDKDGQVDSYEFTPVLDQTGRNWKCSGGKGYMHWSIVSRHSCSDWETSIVTREQYEAAIAAQQPVWDGEGLPPVGCDVEYDSYPDGWVTIGIVARVEDATFIVWKSGTHKGADIMRGRFPIERIRPMRTEAERKREDTLKLMRQVVTNYNKTEVVHAIEQLYDGIAAGKIPGVELSK